MSDVETGDEIRQAEMIAALLAHLDPVQRDRFTARLADELAATERAVESGEPARISATLGRLASFVDGWVISVNVADSADWHDQMMESGKLIAEAHDEVASVDDLRKLLAG